MPTVTRMSRHVTIAVCGIVLFAVAFDLPRAQASSDCARIEPKSGAQQHALIERPGCYILERPFKQSRWFVLSEGGWRSPGIAQMIQTTGTDIEIDLGGLSLRTDAGIGGISAMAGRYKNRFIPLGLDEIHRIRIRNGTIEISDSDGYGAPAIIAPNDLNSSEWRVHSLVQPAPTPVSYRKVEYVLENLTIRTQGAAAMLKGDGIIIRNCTIESRAANALVIYGPNATIENNRIVYRHKDPIPDQNEKDWVPGHYARLRSAIYLRGADRAVVRNNTIDVSRWDRPVSAVAVVESKGVLIEGNRFSTDVTPVVLSGPSSAVLKRNEVEGGWFSKRRMLPDADLQHAK